jgi:hypothetical protein
MQIVYPQLVTGCVKKLGIHHSKGSIQVQLGMAILNVQSCDLVIYSPKSKSFATIAVPFDVQFATELFKIISYKYFNNMLHFVCKP